MIKISKNMHFWLLFLDILFVKLVHLYIIKIIYFDDSAITFDAVKNKKAQASIFISCSILLTFFLYPSILNKLVVSLFIN